jgi:hypothetical protein
MMTQTKLPNELKPPYKWMWSFYLANLFILPVLAATISVVLAFKTGVTKQTKRLITAFILCGVFLVVLPLIFWVSVNHTGMFWVVFICYWVTAHAGCILLGVFGLIRSDDV